MSSQHAPPATLATLPPPPPGRTGWPWTESADPIPEQRPDGRPWPCITVVTPSFNQAEFLEETLRSVLLQGYPALDYLVMDGGSQDGSRAILERYGPWLSYWQSQPDGGQADAVAQGLARAQGTIFNFINSDDVLLPGTLATVGAALAPGDGVGLAGAVIDQSPEENRLFMPRDLSLGALLAHDHFHQPGIWLETKTLRDLGGFPTEYDYCFDKALYLRLAAQGGHVVLTERPLAVFRVHPESKTSQHHARFRDETLRALRAVLEGAPPRSQPPLRRRLRALEREVARAALLAQAEDLLTGPAPGFTARLKVIAQALGQPRAALDPRLLEVLILGTDRRRARQAERRARRGLRVAKDG